MPKKSSTNTDTFEPIVPPFPSKDRPSGRLDILAAGLAERGLEILEAKYGLQGVKENAMPHINQLIQEYLPDSSVLPKEVHSLINIVRANLPKQVK